MGELDRASIAIALASITLSVKTSKKDLQDARRQECLQEEGRQGRARRQEDGEDKSRSKAKEGEESKGTKAKGCTQEKGCSGITWISIHFCHQFHFIVITLCKQ